MGAPGPGAHGEIVELARACLEASPRARDLFFAPDIPRDRERSVRATHALHLPAREPILVLYDATVFGSAEEGFVLTPERLCWKNFLEHPRHLPLRELDPATVLPLRDGVGVAGGVVSTQGISIGGLTQLLTSVVERAAGRLAETGPYRAPEGSTDRAVARLVTLARGHLGEVERVFYHPAIPPSKLANARAVHSARLDPSEPVAALYDGTLFASARDGFLLTPARICWKNMASEPASVEWRSIDPELVMSSPYAVRLMGWEIRLVGGPAFAERVVALILACASEAARWPAEGPW